MMAAAMATMGKAEVLPQSPWTCLLCVLLATATYVFVDVSMSLVIVDISSDVVMSIVDVEMAAVVAVSTDVDMGFVGTVIEVNALVVSKFLSDVDVGFDDTVIVLLIVESPVDVARKFVPDVLV